MHIIDTAKQTSAANFVKVQHIHQPRLMPEELLQASWTNRAERGAV